MKIAIVGFDVDGRATYDYFASRGNGPDGQPYELTICDQKAGLEVPAGTMAVLGEHYLDDLDRFDLIVRTSGMHPRKILDKNPEVAGKITTSTNIFVRDCPTRNIIGVTGTKGKGTTSTLITKLLESQGKDVRLGGNVGLPALTFIDELDANSWVVLELSSFQLYDFKESVHTAVCLMVVPEHLDWHDDFEDYITAKEQLFARQGTADIAIYYHDNEISKRIAGAGQAQKIPFCSPPGAEVINGKILIEGTEICRTDELKLLGKHNWQNVCAAITAAYYALGYNRQTFQSYQSFRPVLTSFTGLPYRLEFIREVGGVRYYNDSFGTTPETAIVAIQAFSEPKVLLLGGSVKGADFDQLAEVAATTAIRKIIVFGNTANPKYAAAAPLLVKALHDHGISDITELVSDGTTTMQDIVAAARQAALPGDVVLLSTGCASFDMFQNYKDRGNQFNLAVSAL